MLILRPKRNGLLAHFYALVTHDTKDQDYSARRQLFLTEQGYHYDILYDHEVPDWQPATIAGQAAPTHFHRLPSLGTTLLGTTLLPAVKPTVVDLEAYQE